MSLTLSSGVAKLLRQAASKVVMPRFQRLNSAEIMEKSPGELVTIADRECELMLAEGLSRLLPDALIIGEEACDSHPALLDRIDAGLVWLIDPIDGTSNFAEGKPPFALMVALLDSGEPLGGWMFDPVNARMCHVWRGEGAWIDDVKIQARASGITPPLAALATGFMTPAKREDIISRASGRLTIVPIPRCAGEQYPRIALGINDLALFERTLPWDHAAGALFVSEAGGRVRRTDGSAYVVGDSRYGLLAAATPALWDQAANILFEQ